MKMEISRIDGKRLAIILLPLFAIYLVFVLGLDLLMKIVDGKPWLPEIFLYLLVAIVVIILLYFIVRLLVAGYNGPIYRKIGGIVIDVTMLDAVEMDRLNSQPSIKNRLE